jgi:hypothetical protein
MHSTFLSVFRDRAGWRRDEELADLISHVITAAGERFAAAKPSQMALSLVLPGRDGATGAAHRGAAMGYPASLVKLFFMVAAEAGLRAGTLAASRELTSALAAMIEHSSNDATSLVVDLLTGTTSGPALEPSALKRWLARRQAVNRCFAGWRCPELAGINLVQKTFYESPYGRDRQSCFDIPGNRNRLSSDAVARLLLAIERGEGIDRRRWARMLKLMRRYPEGAERGDSWNQISGFLGEGLPRGARLWSKAGWHSRSRHDSAIVELADGTRFILVAMTFGPALAGNRELLPFIGRTMAKGVARIAARRRGQEKA